MKRIPEEFFSGFIQQKLHDYQSKDLHEYDLLSFLYYESVLSFEAKTFHLKKLSDYHNVIITL
jgi:hypothetical protein